MNHHLVSSAISCPVELLALRGFVGKETGASSYESVCSMSPELSTPRNPILPFPELVGLQGLP